MDKEPRDGTVGLERMMRPTVGLSPTGTSEGDRALLSRFTSDDEVASTGVVMELDLGAIEAADASALWSASCGMVRWATLRCHAPEGISQWVTDTVLYCTGRRDADVR